MIAGNFLYISLVSMMPVINTQKGFFLNFLCLLLMVAGVTTMYLITLIEWFYIS